MPTTNCGLRALEQMVNLKNVSAFTLIHLAKDNGVNLYFCQVEQDELVSVARPAIFHQNNHFVFVEDGHPLPPGEYDGYVLTPKPLHEPLPYSLAKKVRGQKGGGGAVSAIITGVATIINPVLGAAVGAGFAAHQTTGGGGYFKGSPDMKGQFWRIPVAGATAYLGGTAGTTFGINNAILAGGLAAGSEYAGSKDLGKAAMAGIGQYTGAKFTQGAAAGLAGAGPGSLIDKAWAAGQGGLAGIGIGKPPTPGMSMAPVSTPGSTPPMSLASQTPGMSLASSAPGMSIDPSVGATALPGMSVAPGMSSAAGTAGTAGATAQATAAPSIWDKLGAGKFMPAAKEGAGTPTMDILKLGATALMKPPSLTDNPQANMSAAASYLGNEQYQALPAAVRTQMEEYVNTPIDQLATKFTSMNDKGIRLLEEKKKKEIDEIMVQYANYGQDPYTSSEAQQRLTEINRQYDQAAAELQQQNQQQGMIDAIKFKQDILMSSIQQNQFDYTGFMQLAERMGKAQDAQDAMNGKNYEAMQDILGEILSNTFGAKRPEEVPAMG